MRSVNHSRTKTICYIYGATILWTLGAHAAALPPDPDNAALLYYQAFLLRTEPNDETSTMIWDILRGAEPNENIREYIESCRETLEYAEAAAQIPQLNWGIRYSQGYRYEVPYLVQVRYLVELLAVDARILTADGDYRAALSRCLTIRRIAGHINDNMPVSHACSVGHDCMALRCIQHVLESTPLNADNLIWLQGQLAAVQGASQSPARALEMDLELALQSLRTDPDTLTWVRDQLAKNLWDGSAEEIQNLTDEELVARAREPYADFLNSSLRVIGSELPYEEKYTQLQSLTEELEEEFGSDPSANQIIMACAEQVIKLYSLQVRHIADFNALKAAIEIYLATAETGHLPDILADYLPKDPYSGQDFEYETTQEGFLLRCRSKDILATLEKLWPPNTPPDVLSKGVVHQYEFKVQK